MTNINLKPVYKAALLIGLFYIATEIQASNLVPLEQEVGKIKTFFSGHVFKGGMAIGTVIGLVRAAVQGSIGAAFTTAGIGLGGYAILTWILTDGVPVAQAAARLPS